MWSRLLRVGALLKDPRVGSLPKVAVALAIAYLLWPIDLVPDWLFPVVGWFDDLTIVWLALRWLLKSGPAAQDRPSWPTPTAKA